MDPALSALASNLITSLVYSHDVVSRLSLGSVRDIRNAALWLCDANDEAEGYASVTRRASAWKAGTGNSADPQWVRLFLQRGFQSSLMHLRQFISVRKTLEANMQMTDLFPPGRVLWAIRDGDLHPAHRVPVSNHSAAEMKGSKNKLRLFEVLDVEKVFSQIVFSKDMLRFVSFFSSLISNNSLIRLL